LEPAAGHSRKESVDAVVSPPTSFPHPPEPYREAIKKKFAKAVDLTERFTRSCDYSSGEEAAFDRMMEAVSYTPAGDEPQCRTLVIVDDIVSSGRTAALVVSKVRDAGLPVGARILVAAPLWLPRKSV